MNLLLYIFIYKKKSPSKKNVCLNIQKYRFKCFFSIFYFILIETFSKFFLENYLIKGFKNKKSIKISLLLCYHKFRRRFVNG